METKVNVAEARVNGDWCNIKTTEGKEISIMLSKCPKTKAKLELPQTTPFELELNLVEKNSKMYGWDVQEKKENKGFGGKPKNEKLIVAQSCIGYATQLYMGKQTDTETVLEVAEKFYKWALEKGNIND